MSAIEHVHEVESPDDWLTLPKAAEMLRISRVRLRKLSEQGKVPAKNWSKITKPKNGKNYYRFRRGDLQEILDSVEGGDK